MSSGGKIQAACRSYHFIDAPEIRRPRLSSTKLPPKVSVQSTMSKRKGAPAKLGKSWPVKYSKLAAASFEYFTGHDFPSFAGAPFRFDIVDCTLTFGGNFVLDNLGRLISGASMKWYERHAAWIFPPLDIRCHLRARKQS